jgi:hypothetical protein
MGDVYRRAQSTRQGCGLLRAPPQQGKLGPRHTAAGQHTICGRADGFCQFQVPSLCGWRLGQLRASGSINPNESLKTARKALHRSAPAALAQHMTKSSTAVADAVHVCWPLLISTLVAGCWLYGAACLLSFSSGGSQLFKVMVKENVAYTREVRQRCGTACARSHAHHAAYQLMHCRTLLPPW